MSTQDISRPTRKILVVDDEPEVQIMISQRFRKEVKQGKYEFLFANDGAEALELYRTENTPPLVVTDIRMPRMDGLTLLAEISKINPIQRVVIVSAYGDMNNIRSAMNSGAFDFLTKPMDFADFESTVERALEHIATQEENRRRSAELAGLQHELELAAKIQDSILPARTPQIAGLKVHSFYKSMSTVGGDFYGFFEEARQRQLGIVVADVVGHGVPAAMIASMVRVAFHLQKDQAQSADEVLLGMERVLNESGMISENFVTACYVHLDLDGRRLITSNAGHPPVYLHRKTGEVLELRPAGSILGYLEMCGVETAEVALERGDRIFAFTDGLFEIGFGENTYGQERLLAAFQKHAELPAAEFMNALLTELSEWNRLHGEHEYFDDDLTAVIVDVE